MNNSGNDTLPIYSGEKIWSEWHDTNSRQNLKKGIFQENRSWLSSQIKHQFLVLNYVSQLGNSFPGKNVPGKVIVKIIQLRKKMVFK